MKKLFLLSVAATLISSLSFATIRRIGYPGIAVPGVDFSNIDQANSDPDVNAGDTLQIYGYVGSGNITKKFVILGFGYNLDANTGLQVKSFEFPSQCDINFDAGSDGSFITGCAGNFTIRDNSGSHITISNITFFRCYGHFYTQNNEGYGPINTINIFSCVVTGGGMQWNGVNDYNVTNVSFFNCIMQGAFYMYKPGSSVFANNCVSVSNTLAVGYFHLNDAGGLIKNCILGYSNATINLNTVYENNFFQEAEPALTIPGTNNHWSQDFAAIFTRNGRTDDMASYYGYAEFDEDYWTLATNSPAKNAGLDGTTATDCGIYGGATGYRYKLSGVPAVPAIYQLTAPSLNASSNPYNVTISVRSNN